MIKLLILLITLIPYINGADPEKSGTIEMAIRSQICINNMKEAFKKEKAGDNSENRLIGLLENLSAEYSLYKAYYDRLKHNANNLKGLTDPEILCENYAQLQQYYTSDQINFK